MIYNNKNKLNLVTDMFILRATSGGFHSTVIS